MDSVRWYLHRVKVIFVCWFAGHDSIEDPHARVCFRCGDRRWLY